MAAGSSALSSKEYRAAAQDTAAARVDVAAAPVLVTLGLRLRLWPARGVHHARGLLLLTGACPVALAECAGEAHGHCPDKNRCHVLTGVGL